MSISPLYKGDTPLIHNRFRDDAGSAIPLTGLDASDFAMHLVNKSDSSHKVGTGTWTILDETAGTADYQMSSADTDTAGTWLIYPVVQLPTGPRHFDPQTVPIIDLPG
jgi:hypothetical protein